MANIPTAPGPGASDAEWDEYTEEYDRSYADNQ